MGEGVLMRLAEEDFLSPAGPAWPGPITSSARAITTPRRRSRRPPVQSAAPGAELAVRAGAGDRRKPARHRLHAVPRHPDRRHAVPALRQGMAGEVGYELHGPIEHAREIFNALMRRGQEFGIRRLGGRTKMVNHVEACFPTPSVDYVPAISATTTRIRREYFSANARLELSQDRRQLRIRRNRPCCTARRSSSAGARTSSSITTSSGARRSSRGREAEAPDGHPGVERRRLRRGLCVAVSRGTPYRLHGDAAQHSRLRVRRRGDEGRATRRRLDFALLQLLFPEDAFALRDRRRR